MTREEAGDRAAHAFLAERLRELRPEDAVLSEEATDDRRRLTADRVWLVDPLDGTREYAEGRHDWAVHVALWSEDDSPPEPSPCPVCPGLWPRTSR